MIESGLIPGRWVVDFLMKSSLSKNKIEEYSSYITIAHFNSFLF